MNVKLSINNIVSNFVLGIRSNDFIPLLPRHSLKQEIEGEKNLNKQIIHRCMVSEECL